MRALIGFLAGFILAAVLAGSCQMSWAATPEVQPPDIPKIHIVQSGEYLSLIAEKYGTTWQQLWEWNRDIISHQDLIYPGQKLKLYPKLLPTPKLEPKPLTREEKTEKLALFMFKKADIPAARKEDCQMAILYNQQYLMKYGLHDLAMQRKCAASLIKWTRAYEIWLLSEALIDSVKSDEELYKVVGLVWQESHFVNRRGNKGEVSFYQFLPSTIQEMYDLDEIGLVIELERLENDPLRATETALKMLRYYKWNLRYWNSGDDYSRYVGNKTLSFKNYWSRR